MTHGAVASLALGDPGLVAAILADVDAAPTAPLRATLRMLARLAASPATFTAAEIEPVRLAGVSVPAIRDAICICALFSMIVRCADALGFELLASFDPRRLLDGGYA